MLLNLLVMFVDQRRRRVGRQRLRMPRPAVKELVRQLREDFKEP